VAALKALERVGLRHERTLRGRTARLNRNLSDKAIVGLLVGSNYSPTPSRRPVKLGPSWLIRRRDTNGISAVLAENDR